MRDVEVNQRGEALARLNIDKGKYSSGFETLGGMSSTRKSGGRRLTHCGTRRAWNRPRRGPSRRRGLWPTLLLMVIACVVIARTQAEQAGGGQPSPPGWSEDLLLRLLDAPAETDGRTLPTADGLLLQSYQLRSLRLGDPGRATNLVSILRRMLPSGSRVTEDRPANTLHVLSTRAAQDAAVELISAMDAEAATAPGRPEAATVPEEVRRALESLAAARPDSEQLMKAVAETSARTEQRVTELVRLGQEETTASLRRMLIAAAVTVFGLGLLGSTLVAMAARRAHERQLAVLDKRAAAALTVQPSPGIEAVLAASRDQQERTQDLQKLMESLSISYQADRQRHALLLESVAQKHGELAASLGQVEKFRRDLGDDTARLFLEVNRDAIDQIIRQASEALQNRAAEVGLIAESASRKMEETASRLEVQNARAQVLAEELERTQQEVDALFEKLAHAQSQAQQAQSDANEQRRIAYEKTAQLAKKEAALAGLSLLMQEPVDNILDTLNEAIEPDDDALAAAEDPPDDVCLPGLPPPAEDLPPAEPADDLPCPPPSPSYRIVPVS